jgi:hypothetical protein
MTAPRAVVAAVLGRVGYLSVSTTGADDHVRSDDLGKDRLIRRRATRSLHYRSRTS